jgi:hypothetical protein
MTDIQVRRLGADDIPAAAALTARIFATEDELAGTTALLEAAYRTCPFMPPELCWGAFVEGRLAAKWQILDFRVRVAGNVMRVAGIQGVVAAPDDNFKGYPMLIAREALPELAELPFSIVMGFAQRGGLYTKLGAVPLAPEYSATIDPRGVPRLAPEEDGFRELSSEADIGFVLDVYNETNADRTGSFVRTPEYWPWMVRKPDVHWLTEDGFIGVIDQGTHLEIKEVGGRTPAFYDLALRKLSALARARGYDRISGRIPPDHPFCDAARRYGIEMKTVVPKRSGCIGLVLNPTKFIDALRPGLEQRHEALGLPPLQLTFGGAGFDAQMELGRGSAAVEKVELAVPSSTLLQWAFGIRSVQSSLVEHACDVSAEDEAVLAALFPVGCPFTWGSDRY